MRWAAVVWLSGFGVMNVLWMIWSRTGDASLPGLYDYYAATIGDGLCLPCMVWFGLAALDGKKLEGRAYRFCRAAAITAVAAGACVQLSWIADPDIGLNWTIPAVHRFNLAGWYHAAFFAGMIGVAALLFTAIWFLRREIVSGQSRIWFHGFWCAVMLFGYFHAMDDYVEKYGYILTFFVIFMAGTILQMAYQWEQPQKTGRLWRSLGASAFSLVIAALLAVIS